MSDYCAAASRSDPSQTIGDRATPNCSGRVGEVFAVKGGGHSSGATRAAKSRNAQAGRHDEKVLQGGSFLCHKAIATAIASPPEWPVHPTRPETSGMLKR